MAASVWTGSQLNVNVGPLEGKDEGDTVLFVADEMKFSVTVEQLVGKPVLDAISHAVGVENYTGKAKSTFSTVGPNGRVTLISLGKAEERSKLDWTMLGGMALTKMGGRKATTILADAPDGLSVEQMADFILGMKLRAYSFDKYKTKKGEEQDAALPRITMRHGDMPGLRKALKRRDAIAEGVNIARDLINEPPNVLTPTEFARRAAALEKLGVEIEVLGEKEMKKIGMGALLGVGQGSEQESKVVIMRWNGGKQSQAPLAVVGKGVVFDTGGISIKPAQGMEDMKGDMAGAACVVGLMHTLATRKAKANVIGAIGLVENMPDGKAQRPGDIVKSLSGQTIEIINTDAEGRLVLADVLWYVQDRFKPRAMVNLATLTGAILVALGHERAGLFSNDDALSDAITKAGDATGERVWRMPLGPEYDKIIDSKFADVKNSGGRYGGSITAAQFLQRFVNGVPWAHLDIAGTGMAGSTTDINRSWGPGWGVRLLDRMIDDQGG